MIDLPLSSFSCEAYHDMIARVGLSAMILEYYRQLWAVGATHATLYRPARTRTSSGPCFPSTANHLTFAPTREYERTRIRIYVDGEEIPSIDMELGLGHGVGFADSDAPWGCRHVGKTGHPSGLYNNYRIPFGKRIRVTGQRSRNSPDGAPFWWIVRGTENLPLSLGGVRLPDSARLKLHKVEQYSAMRLEEFNLCKSRAEVLSIRLRSRQVCQRRGRPDTPRQGKS